MFDSKCRSTGDTDGAAAGRPADGVTRDHVGATKCDGSHALPVFGGGIGCGAERRRRVSNDQVRPPTQPITQHGRQPPMPAEAQMMQPMAHPRMQSGFICGLGV